VRIVPIRVLVADDEQPGTETIGQCPAQAPTPHLVSIKPDATA